LGIHEPSSCPSRTRKSGLVPDEIVVQARNWLNAQPELHATGSSKVWGRLDDFMADNYDRLKAPGLSDSDIEKLPVSELTICICECLDENA